MHTFSIEDRPHSASVAEFDGAAPFEKFYLVGEGGQKNIIQLCMELTYRKLLNQNEKDFNLILRGSSFILLNPLEQTSK